MPNSGNIGNNRTRVQFSTQIEYLQLLEEWFLLEVADADAEEEQETDEQQRIEFLGEQIFGLTTYDSGKDSTLSILTHKHLEVVEAITNRTNYEYISIPGNNFWYSMVVNMSFVKDKLNWGTSIRGGWWDEPTLMAGNPYQDVNIEVRREDPSEHWVMIFNDRKCWTAFMSAILAFGGYNPPETLD